MLYPCHIPRPEEGIHRTGDIHNIDYRRHLGISSFCRYRDRMGGKIHHSLRAGSEGSGLRLDPRGGIPHSGCPWKTAGRHVQAGDAGMAEQTSGTHFCPSQGRHNHRTCDHGIQFAERHIPFCPGLGSERIGALSATEEGRIRNIPLSERHAYIEIKWKESYS